MRPRLAMLGVALAAISSLIVPNLVSAAPRHNHHLTIGAAPNPVPAGDGVLIYGKLEKTSDGYRAKLHVLDVRKKTHGKEMTVSVPRRSPARPIRRTGSSPSQRSQSMAARSFTSPPTVRPITASMCARRRSRSARRRR